MKNEILNRITQQLRAGPMSVGELTARCHVCDTAVRKHLKTLHGIRAVYIASYRRADARNVEAVYAWGDGEDAAMPEGIARRIKTEAAALPPPVALGVWGCVW